MRQQRPMDAERPSHRKNSSWRRRPGLLKPLLSLLLSTAAVPAVVLAANNNAAAPRSISSYPGCSAGDARSLSSGALGAGLFECHIREEALPAGETRLYALTLGSPNSASAAATPGSTSPTASPRPFSTLVYLRAQNGQARMSLYKPGSGGLNTAAAAAASGAPDEQATPSLNAGAAAGESFLALGPDAPAGSYLVAVRATVGAPSLDLEVITTPSRVRLAEEDRRALLAVVDECCAGGGAALDDALEATLPFCSVVAPMALSSYSSLGRGESSSPVGHRADWRTDLCHTAPNACDAEGHITRLGLRNAGLRCPGGFPRALGELSMLKHADLSGNDFGGQPFNEVERALAATSALSSLLVSDGNLAGAIGCGSARMGRVRVLDARGNRLDGALPGCLLSSSRLEELYLGGNELRGALPALKEQGSKSGGGLVALSLDNQRGSGLQKATVAAKKRGGGSADAGSSTPAELLAKLPSLRYLALGGNPDLGPWSWPPLSAAAGDEEEKASSSFPRSLAYLDVSSTGLEGRLPARLPPTLWLLDASDNKISGSLPASLARQPALVCLRLGGNDLDGTLAPFADALPPQGENRLLELNVSGNARLHGPVPDGLAKLAAFDAVAAAAASATGGGGGSGQHPRALALDGTSLAGPFPSWLVTRVPPVRAACACRVAVSVGGPDSRLQCPDEDSARVSDLEWQVASDLSYECWSKGQRMPLVDLLTSPSVTAALAARDRGEAWTLGDGGLPASSSGSAAAIAGIVIACVIGATMVGAAAWFFGGRRWIKAQRRRGGGGTAAAAFTDVGGGNGNNGSSKLKVKNSCGGAGMMAGGASEGGGAGPGLPSMLSTATSLGGCLLVHPEDQQQQGGGGGNI